MGTYSRECRGVVDSLVGRQYMLTGATRIDGERVTRDQLKRMIQREGGSFRDRSAQVDILVVGELGWSAADWIHSRSNRVIFVERERSRDNHICMVDDAGITSLLHGGAALCLESRGTSAGTVEIKKPRRVSPQLVPLRLRSVGQHDGLLLDVDLSALDRGSRAHEGVVAALIDHLAPTLVQRTDRPQVDAAWIFETDPSVLHIAEVKSLTETNQVQQLRLGVGQLLDYRYQLEREPMAGIAKVRAYLITEAEPSDPRWVGIANSVGLTLAWPPGFDGV